MGELAGIKVCIICGNGSHVYTTHCSHSFHLECLLRHYHYNHTCFTCNTYIDIPYVQAIERAKCYSCSSSNQLQVLYCSHSYCIPCIINRKIKLECCNKYIQEAQRQSYECPTCNQNVNIMKFSEINCPTHGSLCKKCYNLSLANKECIGACGFKFDFALIGTCFGCSKESLLLYPENECNNNCLICIDCKAWYIINYGQSNRCYICSSQAKS